MKNWVLLLLSAALLLSGCTAAPSTTVPQLATKHTVEDLFTQPVKTLPAGTGSHNATRPTDTAEPTNPNHIIDQGSTSFGCIGDSLLDDYGSYMLYEGGELCVPFELFATGQSAVEYTEYGVGFLLFLDGRPQPYRVGADGDLTYFQVMHPQFDPKTNNFCFDVYFTPVTGDAGDVLELYYATILYPDWQTTDQPTGWKYTFGCCYAGTRLKINATPPEKGKPAISERVNSANISYVDASYDEIGTWNDTELIEKFQYKYTIDGRYPKMRNCYLYDFTASDSVDFTFEIWGTPYVEYGLMFYIDNQPISNEEILFNMQSGQKTIITINVDLSDFDGECAVYAALIPRNARSTEILTYAYLDYSKTYFLLDDPDPEK